MEPKNWKNCSQSSTLCGFLSGKPKLFVIYTIALWTVIYYFHFQQPQGHTAESRRKNSLKILLWVAPKSQITRNRFWSSGELERTGSCPGKCEVFDDRQLVDVADAIVAHGNHELGEDTSLPPQKKWNQIRIFFRLEAPGDLLQLPNQLAYNWTFTYRTDSDVPAYYGSYRLQPSVSPLSTSQVSAMENHSKKIIPIQLAKMKGRYWAGKTKMIAWMASHCRTPGRREKLVDRLKKFLPVNVYGACGPHRCPVPDRWNHDGCFEALGKQYKFYLAFESKLCTDYVTEKLFRPLKFGMVPIVYGHANYTFHAPPGSFIDVRDFGSIRELADFLKFLNKNPAEYLKYFLWTEYYESVQIRWWCDLCDKLWQHSIVDERGQRIIDPSYHKSYANITSWFNEEPGQGRVTEVGEQKGVKLHACQAPPNFV